MAAAIKYNLAITVDPDFIGAIEKLATTLAALGVLQATPEATTTEALNSGGGAQMPAAPAPVSPVAVAPVAVAPVAVAPAPAPAPVAPVAPPVAPAPAPAPVQAPPPAAAEAFPPAPAPVAAAPAPAPVAAPAPVEAAPAATRHWDVNDVRAAMKAYVDKFGREATVTLLGRYGATTVSGLNPGHYPQLTAEIQAAIAS